jgi:signal transduction histidine kinase/CheY-like chemotaxis protein
MPGRASRIARQNEALLTLAKRKWQSQLPFTEEIKSISEVVAKTLRVERIGIWLYEEDGLSMKNLDLYERGRNSHTCDKSIRAIDYPQYFRALEESRFISADDAHNDPRTIEYLEGYLLPKGITSMLDAPIRSAGEVIGIICIESIGRKRTWSPDEQNFVSSVADLLALTFDNFERVKTQKELEYRVEFEQLLLSIANQFINVPVQNISQLINSALETIGQFVGIDRCYTYRFDENGTTMSNTNEWVTNGENHKIQERQKLPLSSFPWAIGQMKSGSTICVSSLDVIPPEGEVDRRNFKYFEVRSLVWVPLIENGTTFGFAGFTSTKGDKQWSPESVVLLRIVGETLVNMYSKERVLREREIALEERRLLELKMEKAQKLESLGLMAGGVAHDFNNLLMGILGNTSLLLYDVPPHGKNYERILQIKKTAERAAQLTNQLLAFSGKGQFVSESVDLGALGEEILTLLRPALNSNSTIITNWSAAPLGIQADSTQIRQVVMNLITNASDALPPSGGKIFISTYLSYFSKSDLSLFNLGGDLDPGEYVTLEVKDTGCGMSQATITKIFDPFFTTKFTGRGLGLAAVHGILRGHKGAIKVQSAVGVGTTFHIVFPAHTIEPALSADPEYSNKVVPITGAVLIIDDEELPKVVVAEMLQQLGYTVFAASSGTEGIEILKVHGKQISGVLVDMTMPDLDGIQTALSLKEIDPDLPIVLMSGYSEADALRNVGGDTISAFLQKPFGIAHLKTTMAQWIHESKPGESGRRFGLS